MTAFRGAAGRTFASLRSRNLRLYFAGLGISQTGTWIQNVALPWLVLNLTHSGTALGITYALQFVPMLVLGPWAGVVTDRYDKMRVLTLTTSLSAIGAVTLGVLTLADLVSMWIVIVIAMFLGAVTAFDTPARRSFVSELVEPDELSNAVSLTNALFTLSRIAGPAVAGLLIATVGIGWCFVVNAASFAAVLVALVLTDRSKVRAPEPIPRERGQLLEGARYSWHERLIRLSIIMSFVVGLVAFNYNILLPILARRTFHVGAGAYSVMFAATGVGAFVGALVAAHRFAASGRLMIRSSILLGALLLAVAYAPTLFLTYVLLVLFGAASMVFISMTGAAIQERASPEFRGRATALFVVAWTGSTPIGAPIVGAVAQRFGPRSALALGGVGAMVAGLVALFFFRRWVADARRERGEDAATVPT